MGGYGRRAVIKRLATLSAVALVTPLLVGGSVITYAATAPPPHHPAPSATGRLIVGFAKGTTPGQQATVVRAAGARPLRGWSAIHAQLIEAPTPSLAAIEGRLHSSRSVRYVEPDSVLKADAVTPNDPLFTVLWGLNNTGQTINFLPGTPDADIDAPEAWGVSTGSSSVTVGVIDTGIDTAHPDLAANIWINPGENCAGCHTDGIDNDQNGYVDDWRGWDFVNNDNNPYDDNGHGTHVAGTIGAVGNNGIGVTGINWNVRLMPLKFLASNGTGFTSDAISALLYATANGADVTNNSYGGDGYSQAMLDAISSADQQGSLFVAAAGNSAANLDTHPGYPAAYSSPNVISVAATTNTDQRANFSNYGPTTVDLGAPGQDIESTMPGGGYQYLSGTSMATPQVAGAAALVRAAVPGSTAAGLKALLMGTVDPLPTLAATVSGGRLNVNTAIRCSDQPMVTLESPRNGFAALPGANISVSMSATSCALASGVTASLDLDGATVPLTNRGDGVYTATITAPLSGSFTLTAHGQVGGLVAARSATGSVVRQIVPGGAPVTATVASSGGTASVVFAGTTGERISLKLSSSSITSATVSVIAPDGGTAASASIGTAGGFIDTRTLGQNGTYVVLIDPNSTYTGSVTLTLYDVPADVTGPIVAGGAPVSVATATPGQNARLTFTATAGQRVSLKITSSTYASSSVSILKPDGITSLGSVLPLGGSGFLDTKTLAIAGTYTVLVDPKTTAVGGLTLTLYDVPADVTEPIVAGGAPVSVTTTTPGQNARLTFTGSASQAVTLTVSSNTVPNLKVSILKPDGTTLKTLLVFTASGTTTATLPVAGSYTLFIDPQGASAGGVTVKLA
jgi:subtilisin family serine protease